MQLHYNIDKKTVTVEIGEGQEFKAGTDEVLAFSHDDVTSTAAWFDQGYTITELGQGILFKDLRGAVESMVRRAIEAVFPDKQLSGFSLDKYHEYVSEQEHIESLDKKIKRFFWSDLQFDDAPIIENIEREVGKKLGYSPAGTEEPHWVIVRVIMPGSSSYNPAHKDIYEAFDTEGVCPRMVNAWIPICGVNEEAGLSLAVGSHLIPESRVVRTSAGSVVNGNRFLVNCIKSWDGETSMQTVSPAEGRMLIFSSHLIHGLGRNLSVDTTRVALEFRLHASEI